MSILDKEFTDDGGAGEINWNPSEGWHEVIIGGIADIGSFPNKYQGGKMQAKVGIFYIFDETLTMGEDVLLKTKIERYTASLGSKSNLFKNIVSPCEMQGVSTLSDLVGRRLRLKLRQEGEYLNIILADESAKDVEAFNDLSDVYVPKFWLQDKEGKPTGYNMKLAPGIIQELRPIADDAQNFIPVATVAVPVPEMPELSDDTSSDLYS